MTLVDEIRGFNRFYTREIGLLAEHLPAGALSLPMARVLYELAQGGQTAAEIGRRLGMDKAHLSRILARLKARGLVEGRISPDHGRRLLLAPTETGRAAFAALENGARKAADRLLAPLDQERRQRLGRAMRDIREILGAEEPAAVRLRGLLPGDLGWIIHRQSVLYHQEYGWDRGYEGLAAEILARFVASFDAGREDGWVAERAGAIMGSVFLMKSEDPGVAKLRLLYVEPDARGSGIGRRLVEACLDRARALGYRSISLWTNDVLVAARHLYQAAGFRLVEEAPHHSFGHDLLGQIWTKDLTASAAGGAR